MVGPITAFKGQYRFLSNFYLVPIYLVQIDTFYKSVEHAYQAHKTLVPEEQDWFMDCSAAEAKRLGKNVTLRPDWENVKIPIMMNLVLTKFISNEELGRLLLDTGDRELIEGNYWGDTFWGQCPVGTGENNLGKILMAVREALRKRTMTKGIVTND